MFTRRRPFLSLTRWPIGGISVTAYPVEEQAQWRPKTVLMSKNRINARNQPHRYSSPVTALTILKFSTW